VTLSLAAALALSARCATSVAPETMLALIQTESRFEPLAIGVNGAASPPPPVSVAKAAALARHYIALGYSVDLGIGQINSRNLGALGLSIEDSFDPCRNLAAAAQLLSTNYLSANRRFDGVTALGVALSLYNTGDATRGYHNGYVGRVYQSARSLALSYAAPTETAAAVRTPPPPVAVSSASALIGRQEPASSDVFAETRGSSLIVFGGIE